jgi:hypothetical protein
MRRYVAIAVAIASTTCMSVGADEPAFPFTPTQFVARFNDRARINKLDIIRALRRVGSDFVSSMADTEFQNGIRQLKQLDLANGQFTYRVRIVLSTNAAGLVTKIIVTGVRSDPVNQFRTMGAVGAVYELLNPGVPQTEEDNFLVSLGLARGDDDPTIGEPQTNFSKGGAFTCNNRPSQVSEQIGCLIIPRS